MNDTCVAGRLTSRVWQAPRASRHASASAALGAARRDEDDLNACVKDVVDALPPLTGTQRDLLALIFCNRHK
jgi:hypothetical protein